MSEMNTKILEAVKYIGYTVLITGIMIFLYGFFVSDYPAVTGIGIGTVMGAIFIFLMGVFFVVAEEMQKKTPKGQPVNIPKLKLTK
jgi:predicted RND superfamily exporter protein